MIYIYFNLNLRSIRKIFSAISYKFIKFQAIPFIKRTPRTQEKGERLKIKLEESDLLVLVH